MREKTPVIRDADGSDLVRITEIYAHYVRTSTATFEETEPDHTEMSVRYRNVVRQDLPWLVAETETGVSGFAYATPWRQREAYRHTVECSIYVDASCIGRGIGRQLLAALIDRCEALGKRCMISVIGNRDSTASVRLHSRLGFRMAGTLPAVGYKLGDWADTILMVRTLGPGDSTAPDN